MKKRSYTLLTYFIAVLLGVTLFLTSERVQRAERIYNDVQEKLITERESYHILKTEWTYLNRPDRLEDLTETHLELKPIKPTTMLTSTETLPIFVQTTIEEPKLADLINTQIDQASAGSVPVILTLPVVSEENKDHLPKALNSIQPATGEVSQAHSTPDTNVKVLKASAEKKIYSPKKQTVTDTKLTQSNRNKSTTSVTFYQYMNEPSMAYPKVRGQ